MKLKIIPFTKINELNISTTYTEVSIKIEINSEFSFDEIPDIKIYITLFEANGTSKIRLINNNDLVKLGLLSKDLIKIATDLIIGDKNTRIKAITLISDKFENINLDFKSTEVQYLKELEEKNKAKEEMKKSEKESEKILNINKINK